MPWLLGMETPVGVKWEGSSNAKIQERGMKERNMEEERKGGMRKTEAVIPVKKRFRPEEKQHLTLLRPCFPHSRLHPSPSVEQENMKINQTHTQTTTQSSAKVNQIHKRRLTPQRKTRINSVYYMLTFGHPLGVRYAGVVEVGVEHDDAERQDKRRVRVRENRPVLPDSIRSVREDQRNKRKERTDNRGGTDDRGR